MDLGQGAGVTPSRKSPLRKKARVGEDVSTEPPVGNTPDSNKSGPALGISEVSSNESASTPGMDMLELNTRRNSLRPLKEDETLTLDAFQNMLDAARDDEIDSPYAPNRASRSTKGTPKDDESPEQSTKKKKGGRRNTASPSMLQQMLQDMSDSEDDNEELLEAARRGKEKAQRLTCDDEKLYISPLRTSETTESPDETPPIALRTRNSARKQKKQKSAIKPTPLRSCISARKKKPVASSIKKKSVVFGSPDAAEFDTLDPVKGGVTPLNKTYTRKRFKMEERLEAIEQGDLIEEDGETALNSSILATWEEEDEEAESSSTSSRSRKSGSSNSSGGSDRQRQKDSGSSRRSRRRNSSIGLRPMTNDNEVDPTSTKRLDEKFDEVANLQPKSAPPPSPGTAERLFQEGKGVPLVKSQSDTRGSKEFANIVESPQSTVCRSPPGQDDGDETLDFETFKEMMRSSPGSTTTTPSKEGESKEGEHTQELGTLSQLASFDTPDRTSQQPALATPEDRTVELGSLSDLAALSSGKKNGRKNVVFPGEDQTVELGALGDLAKLTPSPAPSRAGTTTPRTPEEDATMELGSLNELARFSGASKRVAQYTAEMEGVEENTVELGSLGQLASLTPQTPDTPAEPIGRRVEEKSERQPSPNLRLSFSSMTSSATKSVSSGDNTNTPNNRKSKLLDAAAMLDDFVNSPASSVAPSPHVERTKPKEVTPVPMEVHENVPETQIGGDTSEQHENTDMSEPVEQHESIPVDEPTEQHENTPVNEPSTPENVAVFAAKRTLPRTPLVPVDTNKDKGVCTNSPKLSKEQNCVQKAELVVPTPQTKATEEPELITALDALKICEIEFECVNTLVDGPEDFVCKSAAESDLNMDLLTPTLLQQSCTFSSDMYGIQWGCNEFRDRVTVAKRTISNLSAALEQAKLTEVDSSTKANVSSIYQAALVEAEMTICDLEKKSIALSRQAANEHVSLLKEDAQILQDGIERLELALTELTSKISQIEKSVALKTQLEDASRDLVDANEVNTEMLMNEKKLIEQKQDLQLRIEGYQASISKAEQKQAQISMLTQTIADGHGMQAILDVAHGLHTWRLHHATATVVVFALDQASGTSDFLSIELDETPRILRVSEDHCTSAEQQELSGDQVDSDEHSTIEVQIESIISHRVSKRARMLNEQFVGKPPSHIPNILQELDFEFGRLMDLLTEICGICESPTSTPSYLRLGTHDSIDLALEILVASASAVIDVRFSIKQGYPLVHDSCNTAFEITSQQNIDDLTKGLNQALKLDQPSFSPLTDIWENVTSTLSGAQS